MSLQHATLTGTSLHENKGAATATNNTVATASAGATVWKLLDNTNLAALGNPFGANMLHVADVKAAATDGGGFTSGSFQTRTLNTVVTNQITGASLGSNQITLPVGTYVVKATAPAFGVDSHQAGLYNTSTSAFVVLGTAEFNTAASAVSTSSCVNGKFTLSATGILELRHSCQTTKATDGFGKAANFGENAKFSEVMIWRIS